MTDIARLHVYSYIAEDDYEVMTTPAYEVIQNAYSIGDPTRDSGDEVESTPTTLGHKMVQNMSYATKTAAQEPLDHEYEVSNVVSA